MKKKSPKLCPKCYNAGFIHDGWTVRGNPSFTCTACDAVWQNGSSGDPYYDNALSHPDKIIIVGWTKEDYNRYNLRLEDTMVIFERKK